ncbi:VOC family protein [Acetobacteraceae bacterium H6797]|nr:VOC family protein [Acetobacteraceae bacterium H6797]
MAKPIHSMIRVLDEARSLDFYRRSLGMAVKDRYEFESFVLVYLRAPESDFELELTVNKGQATPYDRGNGYGHLAVAVDDLDAAHARMTAEGIAPEPIKEFHRDGALFARFFFITDPDGYRIEVLAAQGRFA